MSLLWSRIPEGCELNKGINQISLWAHQQDAECPGTPKSSLPLWYMAVTHQAIVYCALISIHCVNSCGESVPFLKESSGEDRQINQQFSEI